MIARAPQHLYLVEIPGVGVKVGVSASPLQRIAAHARDASAYGRSIARTWVSPEPQANALQNERVIKGASPREYLDRSFEECLAEAESLPSEPIEERDVRDSPVTKLLTGMFPAYGEWLDREAAK